MEKNEEVELEQHYIFASIPKDTVALTITATLLDENGTPYQVHSNMTTSDLFQARKDFLDNVGDDDYDARYILTDEGRAFLEKRRMQQAEC